MKLGRIEGKIYCTAADPELKGIKLYVLQPLNKDFEPMGTKIIAADGVGAQEEQIVFWVSAREATLCVEGREIPVDAGIVGIVDNIGK